MNLGVIERNGFSSICVYLVCDCAYDTGNDEICRWLGAATSSASNYLGIHCWENSRRVVVKMKINELVKEVNSYFLNLKAIRRDDGVLIISGNDDALLLVPEKATNFMEVYFCVDNQGMYFTKANRELLSALIEEFLETPIDERYPEKKYRLRWIDEDDGDRNYLVITSGWYLTNIIDDKKAVFTESELEQLKRDAPRLAPAIDAMKEPVEDD